MGPQSLSEYQLLLSLSKEREEKLWVELCGQRLRSQALDQTLRTAVTLVGLQRDRIAFLEEDLKVKVQVEPKSTVNECRTKKGVRGRLPVDLDRVSRNICQRLGCENPPRRDGGFYCSQGCVAHNRWKNNRKLKGVENANNAQSTD